MMNHYVLTLTLAAAALCAATGPVSAQGALKPLEAVVVNPASRPVPVTVIAPTAATQPATVTCRIQFDRQTASSPFFFGTKIITPVQYLDCPSGVTRLDVHRVLFDPAGGGFGSMNVAHFHLMVGIGPLSGSGENFGDEDVAIPLAMLTEGAADISLARPVRIDKGATGMAVMTRRGCSSGIAGFNAACAGVVFLVGTPVN
jgi:hypothetical protein